MIINKQTIVLLVYSVIKQQQTKKPKWKSRQSRKDMTSVYAVENKALFIHLMMQVSHSSFPGL